MSYRIYAFLPLAGVDPWEMSREIAFGTGDEPPITSQMARGDGTLEANLDLAAILKSQWTALQEVRFDSADLDEVLQTTPDETLESAGLFLIEPGSGIRITLENRVVDVSVPLCLAPDSAQAVFTRIWDCLEALQRERGCAAYDQHLDKILNLSSDLHLVLGKYCRWVTNNPQIVQMESAILEAELEEDGFRTVDRPWYSQ